MPADGTLAAITPAEISAALPRQRQLAKDCTPPQQKQLRGAQRRNRLLRTHGSNKNPLLAWH